MAASTARRTFSSGLPPAQFLLVFSVCLPSFHILTTILLPLSQSSASPTHNYSLGAGLDPTSTKHLLSPYIHSISAPFLLPFGCTQLLVAVFSSRRTREQNRQQKRFRAQISKDSQLQFCVHPAVVYTQLLGLCCIHFSLSTSPHPYQVVE